MTQRTYVLPKIAWMYWDTVDLPPLIDQIRRYNTGAFKGWDIRFLNQHMLDEYIKVWDYPAGYKELIPQHKADWIRAFLLSRHGGCWCDASIILNSGAALNELWQESVDQQSDFTGFYTDHLDKKVTIKGVPCNIENWFFIVPRESRIMQLWYEEFTGAIKEGLLVYRNRIMKEGTNLDIYFSNGLNDEVYFTQHFCLQAVLQRAKKLPPMILKFSGDSFFRINKECNLKKGTSECVMNRIRNDHDKIRKIPFIKLSRHERETGIDISPFFNKPHICIVNNLPFHYEMFGYIIEYCVHRKIPLDIYTETKNQYGWLDFYKMNTCSLVTFYKISEYMPINKYSRIVFTTDDDNFPDKWIIPEKSIAIDHYKSIRRPQIKYHIGTRWFQERPQLDYILPAFRLITLEEKQRISKPAVICIGKANTSLEIENFIGLFPSFNSIDFWFIDRKAEPEKYKDYPNIHCVKEMDTRDMLDLCKKSHYIFISSVNKDHYNVSMSASVLIGFTCLCQVVMPAEMNTNYKYKSVNTYTDKIVLQDPDFALIDRELIEIQTQKFKVFDKYLLGTEIPENSRNE